MGHSKWGARGGSYHPPPIYESPSLCSRSEGIRTRVVKFLKKFSSPPSPPGIVIENAQRFRRRNGCLQESGEGYEEQWL